MKKSQMPAGYGKQVGGDGHPVMASFGHPFGYETITVLGKKSRAS
jgi:hypothetical protein